MTPAPGAAACHRCHGRNRITEEVATESVFTEDLAEFLVTFGPYHAHGIMPLGTNREDQPATWLEAATFLETALADYRQIERQEAEDERKRRSKKKPPQQGRR